MGNLLNGTAFCIENSCPVLYRPDNIIGMQGLLWSETAHLSSEFQSNVFPRILAVAERAWHKATQWEQPQSTSDSSQLDAALDADWTQFANTLGHRELQRLDNIGIEYRVPPPGARIDENNELEAVCELPGLPIYYSLDSGNPWIVLRGKLQLQSGQSVSLVVKSPNGLRSSRTINLQANVIATTTVGDVSSSNSNMAVVKLVSCCLYISLIFNLALFTDALRVLLLYNNI